MEAIRPITPTLAVAGQPTVDDLHSLRELGYVGIVNLRNDGEPEQPLSTAAEGTEVRALGMEYLHAGFGRAPFDPENVDAVCAFLDRHEGEKVLVHCQGGGRAMALVLLHEARKGDWPAKDAVERGKAMGLIVSDGLRMMIENYLKENA